MSTNIPSFAALRAFVQVGRLGGIRRAAEELNVSHAVISRHLRALEDALGLALFDRHSGRLTDAGRRYHREVGSALDHIAEATRTLQGEHKERLTIWCAPGLAANWLTARLPAFAVRPTAPAIDLHASDAVPDLANNQADAYLRYLSDDEKAQGGRDIVTIELARPPVFPVATPGLLERYGGPIQSIEQLAHLPLVEEGQGEDWRRWFATQGTPYRSAARAARYGHAHLALSAARAGQGVALGNPFLVADDIAAGRLVVLADESQPYQRAFLGAYVLRYGASRAHQGNLQNFRRWLEKAFQEVLSCVDIR